ncbi:hypothetical protein QQF64_021112 [Cirrhinus molitorella]|uniref:Uncharacterized protein n=1 Tax=Cirrhinus molitorella TaxID=172907 RepID=A0ABR3LEK7_9TELE
MILGKFFFSSSPKRAATPQALQLKWDLRNINSLIELLAHNFLNAILFNLCRPDCASIESYGFLQDEFGLTLKVTVVAAGVQRYKPFHPWSVSRCPF